jgi:hypothetical protein
MRRADFSHSGWLKSIGAMQLGRSSDDTFAAVPSTGMQVVAHRLGHDLNVLVLLDDGQNERSVAFNNNYRTGPPAVAWRANTTPPAEDRA